MRGAGEDVRDLARVAAVVRHRTGPVDRDIAGRLGPELRRTGCKRCAHVSDRIQFLVLDRDELGGVLRERGAFGNDQRDRLADMQHAFARERRTERHDELGAIAAVERGMQRGRADAGRLDVLVRQHRDDAFRRAGCGDVDRADARMRVRRAHERRMGLVRLRRIVDKSSKPAHQRVILDARLEMMIARLIHAGGLRFGQPVIPRDCATSMGQARLPIQFHDRKMDYSETTAIASISRRAAFSTSPATCTTAIAG